MLGVRWGWTSCNRLLLSCEQLSISAGGFFQDVGKARLRRRYLGSDEYTERVGSKKQVSGQAKKMSKRKTFPEEQLWQQTFLTNSFLLFCLTEELVYFKKYTVMAKQRYWDSKPSIEIQSLLVPLGCLLYGKNTSRPVSKLLWTKDHPTSLEIGCNLSTGILGSIFSHISSPVAL